VSQARIGIIGGSGLGQAFGLQVGGQEVQVDTPFGRASGPILMTRWEGVDIAFLSRHGPGHLLSPSTVPYRANTYAFKSLGVTHILASGATGSLREEIAPRHLVICDQVIDKTFRREGTFFDRGMVAHVEFAEPFCPTLRALLRSAGGKVNTHVHPAGTYVCMEGPQFSTVAESRMHQAWGGDLIGMTAMPEAKLAREAEMCYALIALPTDYDCWRPKKGVRSLFPERADAHAAEKASDPFSSREALLEEIIGNLNAVTANSIELLRAAVPALARQIDAPCACREALGLAIWSDRAKIDPSEVERLRLIVGRYFA
jgi:5'-methylthioadenosine phosphorylase